LGKEAPLNRKELVDAIQKHTEVARADVDKVLASLIQHTQVAVKKGDRISLVGFGTFERRDRKARTARNPRTGTPVKVKATKIPAFRAGQGFKDVVSGKASAPKLTAPKGGSRSNGSKASGAKSTRPARATAAASRSRASSNAKAPAKATAKASSRKK
jgi:DNA-binding protein HU-beta